MDDLIPDRWPFDPELARAAAADAAIPLKAPREIALSGINHGSPGGATAHRRRGEKPCPQCACRAQLDARRRARAKKARRRGEP